MFEIFFSNYGEALAKARREADDEQEFGYFGDIDKASCLEDSAVIDPELLPPAKKSKFAQVFGANCRKFEVDVSNMYADKSTTFPVAGAPGIKGIEFREHSPDLITVTKTFVTG